MPRIVWNENLCVNIPEIDAQHQRWIDIINLLHDTLMNGDNSSLIQIKLDTLKLMRDYGTYHFATEEEYMKKMGYPGWEAHKQLHDGFILKIKELGRDIQERKGVLNTGIMKILMDWLQNHILQEDKKLSAYAAASVHAAASARSAASTHPPPLTH